MTSDWYSTPTVTSWQGAPFISRGNFVFVNGIFFAVVSDGDNKHARASIAELEEHFRSGSANDRPAHWFEAQLVHYGLKPCKVKSAARMRLFDAVNGGLSVPARMSKIECRMKRAWKKMMREAKKLSPAVSVAPTTVSTPAATERVASVPMLEPMTEKVVFQSELTLRTAARTVSLKRGADEPVTSESEPKRPKTEIIDFGSAPKGPKTELTSPDTRLLGSWSDMTMARRGGSHQSPGRASATRSMDLYSSPGPASRQTIQTSCRNRRHATADPSASKDMT